MLRSGLHRCRVAPFFVVWTTAVACAAAWYASPRSACGLEATSRWQLCSRVNRSNSGNGAAPAPAVQPNAERVRAWFEQYDAIRRRAQMTAAERKSADALLKRGFTILLPGFGRISAHRLLRKMIARYETASSEMKELPAQVETRELHEGYTRYFDKARLLFDHTRKAINNPLRSRKELVECKHELADLEASLKTLDKQLREKFGIATYAEKTDASDCPR